ncbi:MAG: hypothetical protein M1816_000598, partial [Peltula sp. TS41687]
MLQERTLYDPVALIREWQDTTVPEAEVDRLGIAGRLHEACIEVFTPLIKHAKQSSTLSKEAQKKIKRNFGLFCLWGDGHRLADGELDSTLQKSSNLRRNVLSLLISIAELLSENLAPYVFADRPRTGMISVILEEARCSIQEDRDASDDTASCSDSSEFSYSDDGDDDEGKIRNMLEDLTNRIECLIDLEPLIKWPVPDIEIETVASVKLLEKDRLAHQYYADLIRTKFPDADLKLVDQLGRANWDRYERLQAEKVANAVNAANEPSQLSAFEEAAMATVPESKFHDSGIGCSLPAETIPAETIPAETIPAETIPAETIPAETTYAPTVASSFLSSFAGDSRACIPPLSEAAKAGTPFTCDACGKMVRISRTRVWRKHIYGDLRPYVCFYENCAYNAAPFKDRDTWTDHLGLDHGLDPDWEGRPCPLCLEMTGPGRGITSIHIARHLEEIAMSALPKGPDSEANSENGSVTTNQSVASVLDQPVEVGAHTNVPLASWDSRSALQVAAEVRHAQTVKTLSTLVEAGTCVNINADTHGQIVLQVAAEADHDEIAETLYASKAGINVNAHTPPEITVQVAAEGFKIVRKLVEAGAYVVGEDVHTLSHEELNRPVKNIALQLPVTTAGAPGRQETDLGGIHQGAHHLSKIVSDMDPAWTSFEGIGLGFDQYQKKDQRPFDFFHVKNLTYPFNHEPIEDPDHLKGESKVQLPALYPSQQSEVAEGLDLEDSLAIQLDKPMKQEPWVAERKKDASPSDESNSANKTRLAGKQFPEHLLFDQGRYHEAEKIHRQAVGGQEKQQGPEHPDTLRSLRNLAYVLSQQGRYKEAEKIHRQALGGQEKQQGPEHPDTLRSLDSLAYVLFQQGKYQEAEKIHRQALGGQEKQLGPEHLDTLRSLNNLAVVLAKQGRCQEAEKIHRRVLDAREKQLGPEHPDTLSSLSNLAYVLSNQCRYQEAEKIHRQALDALEKQQGPEHLDTLSSLDSLAIVLSNQGRYQEAEKIHRQALGGQEKQLGPEHLDTLRSLNNLAVVLAKQGRCQEAEKIHRRVLDAREKQLGPEHLDTLCSLNNLATVLSKQGRYQEAEKIHRQALGGQEKQLGPEHPNTLSSLGNLAAVLSNQGKYQEAEKILRQALGGQEKQLGPEHPDTLSSLNSLAYVLSNQGRYQEAEKIHRRVLEAREKQLGPEHLDTLSSLDSLAIVLSNQGRYQEAEKIHRQALGGQEKQLGPEHLDTLRSLNNLAVVLAKQGRCQEAEKIHRRVLDAREKQQGPEHPDTLRSLDSLAYVLFQQGKYQEAEKIHRKALGGQEKQLGPEHPDTLRSLGNLATLLSSQGRYQEAEKIHRQVLVAQEKQVGPEHPSTLRSLSNLAYVLSNQCRYQEAEKIHRQALDALEKQQGP